MIASAHNANGSTRLAASGHANGSALSLIDRIVELDTAYFERRQEREAVSTYTAGTSDRMNPVPKGVDPLGTDADYHCRTERNYFLMVERGRAADQGSALRPRGDTVLRNRLLDPRSIAARMPTTVSKPNQCATACLSSSATSSKTLLGELAVAHDWLDQVVLKPALANLKSSLWPSVTI